MSLNVNKNEIDLIFEKADSKGKIFINTFTLNYWYIFLFWIFSLTELGVFVSYGILFLKTSILGIVFSLLIKTNALFGTWIFLIKMLGQIIFIIPIMYFILLGKINEKNKIVISTVIIVLYSILNALI